MSCTRRVILACPLLLAGCAAGRWTTATDVRMGEAHIAATALEPEGWVIVESQMFLSPILVRRVSDGHIGLVLECTHKACTLDAPRPDRISCPCHGSRFDEEGAVKNGPARRPLDRVDVMVDGTRLRLVAPRPQGAS